MLGALLSPARMNVAIHVTNDPYLASFVLSEGVALAGSKRLGPKTVEFSFLADRRLHELLRVYWSGQKISVAPVRLFASLRMLKKRSQPQC